MDVPASRRTSAAVSAQHALWLAQAICVAIHLKLMFTLMLGNSVEDKGPADLKIAQFVALPPAGPKS
jgi:hypothetical protein